MAAIYSRDSKESDDLLKYTSANTLLLANCLSSPKEYNSKRYREAPFQKSKEKFSSEE
jgi:hypothetical protein